jgi:hypothetical protein
MQRQRVNAAGIIRRSHRHRIQVSGTLRYHRAFLCASGTGNMRNRDRLPGPRQTTDDTQAHRSRSYSGRPALPGNTTSHP